MMINNIRFYLWVIAMIISITKVLGYKKRKVENRDVEESSVE